MKIVRLVIGLLLILISGGCQTTGVDEDAPDVLNVLGDVVPRETLLLPLYMYPEGYVFVREQPIPPNLLVATELQVKLPSGVVLDQLQRLLVLHQWNESEEALMGEGTFLVRAEKKDRWLEFRGLEVQGVTTISMMVEVKKLPDWIDPVFHRGSPTKQKRYSK